MLTVDNLQVDGKFGIGHQDETYVYANSDVSAATGDIVVPVSVDSYRFYKIDFWLVPDTLTTSVDIQIGDTSAVITNYRHVRTFQTMDATATVGDAGSSSAAAWQIQTDAGNTAGTGYGGTIEIYPGYWDTTFFQMKGILRNSSNWYTWKVNGANEITRIVNNIYFKTTPSNGYNAGWIIVKGYLKKWHTAHGRNGQLIP